MPDKPKIPREVMEAVIRELFPGIDASAFLPEDLLRRARGETKVSDDNGEYKAVRLPQYMRDFLATMSAEDVKKLHKLMELKTSTVEWIAQKNDKELMHLDGAVEFVVSSRTSAKILIWLMGISFTIVTSTWALAKLGIDVFNTFRGGIK